MHFNMAELSEREQYKLLVSLVVPRPIAFVTTVNEANRPNAAPFSFFNVLGHDPPVLALGLEGRKSPPGAWKDTAANIRRSGEFVVNMVDEALLDKMNICAIDFPCDVDELSEAQLTALASSLVAPPRIGESPAQFECRELVSLNVGRRMRMIVVGEVLSVHVRDDLIAPESLEVDVRNMNLVARLHGRGWYLKTTDWLEVPRLTVESWEQMKRSGES